MVFEAVHDRAVALEAFLEMREPLLDAAPAGGHEVDEKPEVVDARVPLGEQVALDPLQAADDLIHQPANLGEMAGARPEVLAQSVLDRLGQPRLELRRRRGQRFDRVPGPFEGRFDRRGIDPPGRGLVEPLLRAFDGVEIHGCDDTTRCGWMSQSSTTSFRKS